ncbi:MULTISPECIES: GNAT family N-acetyltransferase [Sphingobacterium]|jgi:RimJ/RimL family protein N-acetyltransferase|uniref:GNAT family N-acetyltransferase n=2 Tax=Sphingobacterium TaxID=28453 RepID=A0ACD5BZK6_9SPHI|nr:GNAT family N-acetyltransferase [Sphingobacterium siyangense]QRY59227.1 GNAT family N-acetyltransferase [Sphingobacterium siyangense]
MKFVAPNTLENDKVVLRIIEPADFDTLYQVARDPLIWEQHPNRDRWKEDVFRQFFEGALASKSAYLILDKESGACIGSTRYYGLDEAEKSIFVGYTFYARAYWGAGINPLVKEMMFDFAFNFVDRIYLHVGAENYRSQTAVERLGAIKVAEKMVSYVNEPERKNFEYALEKSAWRRIKR